MKETCNNCGRAFMAHLNGRCPIDTHVVIDVDTISRMQRTGHPRLLKNLLHGTLVDQAFQQVTVDRISIEGQAVAL